MILTTIEQRLAKAVAIAKSKRRTGNSEPGGPEYRKMGPSLRVDRLIQGLGAELAVARHLNVYPDLGEEYSALDLTWRGVGVEVKSTYKRYGDLLVPAYQKGRGACIYVLAWGRFPQYEIVGFSTPKEIFREQNRFDPGKGECYKLDREELRSMTELC